jgi:hypothetical protein
MSIRSRGFIAAMEDDSSEVEINIEPGVPAEVEVKAAEVAEDANEIQQETESMEDAVADAETLDMIANTAEKSVEEGEGMDPVAAEIAEVAVESIYARLGVERKAIPSLESFGSAGSRKSATRIAIEDWKDTVKKVWEAVKKFFVNLYEKIKNFILNVINTFRSLEKAAKSMKARVLDLKGEAKEKTIKDKSLAKGLGRGETGTVTAAKAIETVKLIQEIGKDSPKVSETASEALSTIAKITTDIKQIIEEKNIHKVEAASEDFISTVRSKLPPESQPLFNGDKIIIDVKEEGNGIAYSVTVKHSDKGAEELNVLTKQEMITICDEVVTLAKNIDEASKSIKKVEEMTKNVTKIVDGIIKLASEGIEEEQVKRNLNLVRSIVLSLGSATTKIASIILGVSTKTGRAALSYVAKSMNQYGEKKEEKKD